MSLKAKSEGRQCSDFAVCRFNYEDLNVAGFIPAVELPADAIILGVSLGIEEAFDAASTIAVGTSGDGTAYIGATAADALAITAAAATTLHNHGVIGAVTEIGLTPSAIMTAGSGNLIVEYVRAFRAHHSQG